MAYGDGTKPYRRSDGRWIAAIDTGWTERGTRRRRTVSATTEAECRRRLRALKRELSSGATAGRAGGGGITVKRWADEWLTIQSAKLRPKSFAVSETMVRKWIIPTIGSRRLADLVPSDARKLTAAHQAAGNSDTTARTCHVTLMKLLHDAVAEGHAVPAPVLATPAPRPAISTRGAIPVADMLTLLHAAGSPETWRALPEAASAQDHKSRRLALAMPPTRWLAALVQGMRQGECLGLTWDRVDLEAGSVTVDRQMQAVPRSARDAGTIDAAWYGSTHVSGAYYLVPVKSRAGRRVVPLVPGVRDALAAWQTECPESPWGLVWPRPGGGPWSSGDDRLAWRGLQDAAGVRRPDGTHWVVHEARHSTATLLMALRVPEPVQMAVMGHSVIATTQGYQHAGLEDARMALSGVAGLLGMG